MRIRPLYILPLAFAAAAWILPAVAGKSVKNPVIEEGKDGARELMIPDDIETYLDVEFPKHRLPKESDFDPEMLKYYYSNLIGVHPAVTWGDFNGDKKRDYAFLLITGDTKWGPLCELVVMNGDKNGYEAFRLGEVYNFKDDYVSFSGGKLYKGRYKKGGWYINWDPKKKVYVVLKS